MINTFDPYEKWLGIRQDEIDHYRLLGIKRFEGDARVINTAADQRMRLVKSMQNGPHCEATQDLLNEIAKARVCLLDERKRCQYDKQLAGKWGQETIDEEILPPPSPRKRPAKTKPISIKEAWRADPKSNRHRSTRSIVDQVAFEPIPRIPGSDDDLWPQAPEACDPPWRAVATTAVIATIALGVWFACWAVGHASLAR